MLECYICDNDLSNCPAFVHNGSVYCFMCLKKEEKNIYQDFINQLKYLGCDINKLNSKLTLFDLYKLISQYQILKIFRFNYKHDESELQEKYKIEINEWEKRRDIYIKEADKKFKLSSFYKLIFFSLFAIYLIAFNRAIFYIILIVISIIVILRFLNFYKIRLDCFLDDFNLKNSKPRAPTEPSLFDIPFIPNSVIEKSLKNIFNLKMIRNDNRFQSYSRARVLLRDNYTCQSCGSRYYYDSENLEAHHVYPVSSGGSDDMRNVVTLCKYCHDRENWFGHNRAFKTTLK